MSWVERGRASPALSTIKCLDRGKKKDQQSWLSRYVGRRRFYPATSYLDEYQGLVRSGIISWGLISWK